MIGDTHRHQHLKCSLTGVECDLTRKKKKENKTAEMLDETIVPFSLMEHFNQCYNMLSEDPVFCTSPRSIGVESCNA